MAAFEDCKGEAGGKWCKDKKSPEKCRKVVDNGLCKCGPGMKCKKDMFKKCPESCGVPMCGDPVPPGEEGEHQPPPENPGP